jgi:hypothetical protein
VIFFAIWIEHALLVAVDRLQCRRAGEEQRVALLGGPGQVIRCAQHLLMIPLRLRHCPGEVLDRIPQCRQRGAVVEHDGVIEGFDQPLLAIWLESFR